jgi:hypothetical protein
LKSKSRKRKLFIQKDRKEPNPIILQQKSIHKLYIKQTPAQVKKAKPQALNPKDNLSKIKNKKSNKKNIQQTILQN